MDQISLPMRIALAVTLVFAGLWLVVLRPRPVDTSAPAPTPAAAAAPSRAGTSVTDRPAEAAKAVESANATSAARERAADAVGPAAAKGPASSAATERPKAKAETTTSTASRPAAGNAATKAKAPGARAVVADVEAHRPVVLLFWAMNGADDRAVKRAVDAVDTHRGAVRVHTARMRDLPAYEPITRNAPVTTSPAVFVIDRDAQAHVISGLTTTREIDALVRSVLKK